MCLVSHLCISTLLAFNALSALSAVERFFNQLCIGPAVFIEDVGILVCDHLRLRMPRISLHRLDVAAVEFQLVGDAGVPQAVEHNRRQVVVLNQILHGLPNP